MNTPAHLAASLLVWRHEVGWRRAAAITLGAFLPDLPMFGFYIYQKCMGSAEAIIWGTLYFRAEWQLFFDLFNSIPIGLCLFAICYWRKSVFGELLCASAILHMLCDLPVHHDDAHRHFLPLSSFQVRSPISYWDPAHHGVPVAALELIFAIAACSFVGLRARQKPLRVIARVNLSLYGLVVVLGTFAWITWQSE